MSGRFRDDERGGRRSGLRRVAAALVVALAALAIAGCARQGSTGRQLTQRQRDSTLGASALPGAFVVKRALKESDRAAGAAAEMNAQVDSQGP
jgi:hypothetical protein